MNAHLAKLELVKERFDLGCELWSESIASRRFGALQEKVDSKVALGQQHRYGSSDGVAQGKNMTHYDRNRADYVLNTRRMTQTRQSLSSVREQ